LLVCRFGMVVEDYTLYASVDMTPRKSAIAQKFLPGGFSTPCDSVAKIARREAHLFVHRRLLYVSGGTMGAVSIERLTHGSASGPRESSLCLLTHA
jgi:hypothetical protein